MRKDLKVHLMEPHSKKWHAFRQNGIGGSEIGTVLGINKYDTAVRLYHEKIGNIEPRKIDSERMFWGRINEENIARIWNYYDGTKDGYVENFKNNKIVRKCRSVKGYVVNPDYPWLFASVDRLINIEGGFNLLTGEPLEKEGVLECKNMSYWVSQMWEDGVPIYHLAQVSQYFIVLDSDYAEIAMLVDGGTLQVEKIQEDIKLNERILTISKAFWYNRVIPAREAVKKRNKAEAVGNLAEVEKWETEIQRYEPDPDESDAYKEFMEEKFVKVRQVIDGTMELYSVAKHDNFLKAFKNKLDKERNRLKNTFIQFLSIHGAESIDFGKLGVVNWSERKGSKSRTFNNRTKEKPGDDVVEREFDKLDPNNF
jgi:putative phage-type endonuclease